MKNSNEYIPFHAAAIGPEELDAVRNVLLSGWLTTGAVAQDFEKRFAEYIGCRHALAVNSGTAALQLALDAIRLQPGDEVLVPSYTFTATAEVVTYFGARPVLCDSLKNGFNIDLVEATRHVTDRVKAIIPVHIGGEPCDMDAVENFAAQHSLTVVEDAAHALPSVYRGRNIGAISPLTAFSFYATKSITTGEGGMLTTNSDELAERAAIMRLHGIGKDAWNRYSRAGSWYYQVVEAGYKLNLCDILAALGVAQLQKCDAFWKRRAAIAGQYHRGLASIEELEMPPAGDPQDRHAWHLFILRLKPEALDINRDQFIEELKEAGIGSSVHFIPLHRHPYYRKHYGCTAADFPHAENAFNRSLSLPIYPGLSEQQVERVIASITDIVCRNRKRHAMAV